MQNLSKIRSNSCIHRFILIILPHFVINDHKFYPLYHHLKINLNPSHHSPNVQLSFSFDPLTRDFNPLSTSSNSLFFFFISFPNFSLILLFFFFFIRGKVLCYMIKSFLFIFLSLEFSFLFILFWSSLSSFSLPIPRYWHLKHTNPFQHPRMLTHSASKRWE